MANNTINQSLINEYRELKALENELLSRLKEIEQIIKNEMDEQDISVLFVGDATIRYTSTLRSTFDTKAFKQAYEDLYKAYLKQNPTKRFTIN